MKKRENIKKQRFWKFMGHLPIILIWLALFIYLTIKQEFAIILIFLIALVVFYLAILWAKFCVNKEYQYKANNGKGYY